MSEKNETPVMDAEQRVNYEEILKNPVNYSDISYDQITVETIEAVTKDVIERADAWVEKIVASDELDWTTIMAPLNEMADELRLAYAGAFFMSDVSTDEHIRDAAADGEEEADEHEKQLWYRDDLYAQIKAYSETPEAQALEGEKARLLTLTLQKLKRLGHELSLETRARMLEIDKIFTKHETDFEKNLREDKTTVTLTAAELTGLSDDFIQTLKQDKIGNYIITMDYATYVPFMENATDRQARQKVYLAYDSRVIDTNRPILEDTMQLRLEYAQLLGYPSWAHYQLETCMAKTPETVDIFYADIVEPLTTKGEEELAVLTAMLHADGHDDHIHQYDWGYYDNKLVKQAGVDKEKAAEYFSLDAVIQGLFEVTGETFGVHYKKLDDVSTWHEDVQAFGVYNQGSDEQIATFYMDLFPRDGKHTHTSMFPLVPGRAQPDGSYRQPSAAIVTNFTKPTTEKPSLLKYSEVNAAWHEFGHVLHELLTQAELVSFAGTEIEMDLVEAPSQILEHWIEEPEILQRFGKHYKTGEPIPEELVHNIVAANKINVGLRTLRQVSFGYLDLALHDSTPHKDLGKVYEKSLELMLMPYEPGAFMPAHFGHLFGYASQYYGYLLSESIGDDMYESRFKKEGITNPAVGMDFRHAIQEVGGTQDGDVICQNFLGRAPSSDAFLKKLGIIGR